MRKEYDFSKAKRGAVIEPKGKTRITIYLDDDVLEAYRSKSEKLSRGYQTLINKDLRQMIGQKSTTVDAKTLRRILREELRKAG